MNRARSPGSRSRAATRADTIGSDADSYASLHEPTISARTPVVSTLAVKRANASSHSSSAPYESTEIRQATEAGSGSSPVRSAPGKPKTGRPYSSRR